MNGINTFLLKSVATVVLLLLLSGLVSAQNTISGKVTDGETGEPLIGVNIITVGNDSYGTITDFDGNYSIEIPPGFNQLRFSYTGYADQIVDIGSLSGNTLNIKLAAGRFLEEIVVVGYGTQKTAEVTSAVSSIKAEDFNKGNIQNAAQLLQGKVAGVSIAKPGGDPNGSFQIRLRGLSTFGENTSPLVVIDGVPGANLNTVDPEDIATIDVLRDASAAAIYGTRGASGVILITTKSGNKDNAQVEYHVFGSLETVARKLDVLTADEYLTVDGAIDLGDKTDWFDELTRNAISQTHNLSMSGGTSKTDYRVSVNYRDGQGVAVTTGFDQLNGRINVSQKALQDRLKLSFNLTSTLRNEDLGVPDAYNFAARYNPTAPVFDEASEEWGGYFQADAFNFFNPLAVMEQNIREVTKKLILGSLRADLDIVKGLRYSLSYSQGKENDMFSYYFSKKSYWTPFATKSDKGYAGRFADERNNRLFETTATYETAFSGLELKLLGGYSFQEFLNEGFRIEVEDFSVDEFDFNRLSAGTNLRPNSYDSYKNQNRLIAFFGRLNLNYRDKAFLMASLRREGSSRFGENNKWGLFPGVSGGLNLTKFFKIPSVDQLKIRAGYGVTGNQSDQSYLSILRFAPDNSKKFFYAGEYIAPYGPVVNANPDLKWEKKTELNFGLDFNLFDYKLNGAIDYYITNTNDLILNYPVPLVPPYIADRQYRNVGEMEGSGLELTLGTEIGQGDFRYVPDLAFTKFFDTKLVKISIEGDSSRAQQFLGDLGAPFLTGTNVILVEEGKSIGQIYGPVYNGLDENGFLSFKDLNGDSLYVAGEDFTTIGNALPKWQIGLNNSFYFKNLDINFFIRGVFGHKIVNSNNARYGVPAAVAIQNGMAQALDYLDATNGPVFSDVHVEDGSFVRLDNATIGYTFNTPGKMVNSIRVYLTGQNLLTFTGYSGTDPEVRFVDDPDGDGRFGNPLAPGIDRENTYVFTRTFTFGLRVNL